MSCNHGLDVPAAGLQSAERGSELYSYVLQFCISCFQLLPAVCSATRSFCGAQAKCLQQVSRSKLQASLRLLLAAPAFGQSNWASSL